MGIGGRCNFANGKLAKSKFEDVTCSGPPISVTDEKHRKRVNDLLQSDRRITRQRIAIQLSVSKERVGHIIERLGYRKICARRL